MRDSTKCSGVSQGWINNHSRNISYLTFVLDFYGGRIIIPPCFALNVHRWEEDITAEVVQMIMNGQRKRNLTRKFYVGKPFAFCSAFTEAKQATLSEKGKDDAFPPMPNHSIIAGKSLYPLAKRHTAMQGIKGIVVAVARHSRVVHLVDLLNGWAVIATGLAWTTSAWEAARSTWHTTTWHSAGHTTFAASSVELHHDL